MKISTILFLLLSIRLIGFGQFEEKNIITECRITSPDKIIVANLNGDNFEDFFAVSSQQNKILAFKNNEKGDFISVEIDIQEERFNFVSAIDFNTDELTDLLIDSYSEKALIILINEGDGHFKKSIIAKYNARRGFISEIQGGDIDQDGDIDIIVSIQSDEDIIIYENKGNSILEEKKINIKNKGSYSINLTDIDSDGDIDILSNNTEVGKVIWLVNDGKGNFSEEINLPISHEYIESMSLGDVNQDGLVDIFVTMGFRILWYQNLGNGQFSKSKLISHNSLKSNFIKVLDLNNDGFLDLLPVQNLLCYQVEWFKNTGNNSFEKQIIEFDFLGDNYFVIEPIDLNNDNKLDLVFASKFKNKISGLINNGDGQFQEKMISQSEVTSIQGIKTGDLDGDNIPDLITSASGDYKIAWHKNDGKGNFLFQKNITTTAKYILKIIIVDLNNDTYLDIVSVTTNSFEEDKISWYKNDGKGNFSEEKIISSNVDFPKVFIHDLDLDGSLDIISTESSFNYYPIELYRNNGQDSFYKQIIADSAYVTGVLLVKDLNKDGLLDIIVGSNVYNVNIAWFKNIGNLKFAPPTQLLKNTSEVNQISFADLNLDGEEDLVYLGDSRLLWFENNGKENFSTSHSINNFSNGKILKLLDFDSDGDIDIITGDWKVTLYENMGKGTFTLKQEIKLENNGEIVSMAIDDLDSDGKLDIIYATKMGDKIIWYKNNVTTN